MMRAPSSMNSQPWNFYVVTGEPLDRIRRGKVVERTGEGASEHINKMARKYLGQDVYPFAQPGEVRVIFKIEPVRINSLG